MSCQINRKKISGWLFLLIIVNFITMGGATKAHAEEGIGFSYRNQLPKNQSSQGSYFDLLVKPSLKQTLVTEIKNESQTEMTVKISINDSKTTPTGTIEYGPSSLRNTEENVIKLTELLSGPTEVTLKSGETKNVEFQLRVPEKSFEGVILGGIQLEQVMPKTVSKKAVSVKNKYAYAFSVSLRESEKKITYQLSSVESSYNVSDNQGQVTVDVENDSQEIVKELTLATVLTEKDSNEVIVEEVVTNLKMAPKSIMAFQFNVNDLAAGNYVTKTLAKAGGQEWQWENTFEVKEIKSKPEKQLIETDVPQVNYGSVILIGFTVLIGTAILFIVLKLARKN